MSDYIVKDTELTSVANAIRTKGGTNSQLVFPGGFVSAIGNISGGGGSSDLTWILPEQTVTLVDQPVEVTGLRLDLIPNSVKHVPLKSTSAELGGNVTSYHSLQYFNGELATDSGEIFISNIDGKYMFGVTDGESIAANTYTISIALF